MKAERSNRTRRLGQRVEEHAGSLDEQKQVRCERAVTKPNNLKSFFFFKKSISNTKTKQTKDSHYFVATFSWCLGNRCRVVQLKGAGDQQHLKGLSVF